MPTEFLSNNGVKFWKIVKLNKGCKLILFFEKHADKLQLKENGMKFGPPDNKVDLVLSDHGSPNLKKKKAPKKKTTDRSTEKKKEKTSTTHRQKKSKDKAKERTKDKSQIIAEVCKLLRSLV